MSSYWILATALCVTAGYPLAAQEGSNLGVNLSIGSSSLIGVTARAGGIQLRPSVGFSYTKISTSGVFAATSTTTTRFSLNLDLLFPTMTSGVVIPYWGVGAGYQLIQASGNGGPGDGHAITTQGFFGMRVRVVDRVHVYGELGLAYTAERDVNQDFDLLGLRTTPLGVLIYLK